MAAEPADLDVGSGRGVVHVHAAERDHPAADRGSYCRGDLPDLGAAGAHAVSGRRHDPALEVEPDEPVHRVRLAPFAPDVEHDLGRRAPLVRAHRAARRPRHERRGGGRHEGRRLSGAQYVPEQAHRPRPSEVEAAGRPRGLLARAWRRGRPVPEPPGSPPPGLRSGRADENGVGTSFRSPCGDQSGEPDPIQFRERGADTFAPGPAALRTPPRRRGTSARGRGACASPGRPAPRRAAAPLRRLRGAGRCTGESSPRTG